MKNVLLNFALLIAPAILLGQDFKIKMDGIYNDKGAGVIQLANGDIIYFGATSVNAANTDFDLFFNSFTNAGISNWSKRIPLAGEQIAYTIQEGSNNTFFVLARNAPQGTLLIKLDAAGTVLWSKSYSVSGYSSPIPLSLKESADGSIVFLCTYASPSVKGHIFKVDASGNMLWAKIYNPAVPPTSYLRSIQILSDGNYLLTGAADTDLGSSCLIKMDPNGNIIWQRNNQSSYVFEIFQSTVELDNGDILTGGYVYRSNRCMLLFKYNAQGSLIWSRTYTMPGNEITIMSMRKMPTGDIMVCGVKYNNPYSENNAQNFICQISSTTGNIVWSKWLGQANDVLMTQIESIIDISADGGILCAGTVFNGLPNDSYAQLIKTNANGLLPNCPLTNANIQPVSETYTLASPNSFSNINPEVTNISLQTVNQTLCISNVCNASAPTVNVQLGADTTVCGSFNITLSPNLSNSYTYLWSTSAQTPNISVSSAGTYWVIVSDACGILGRDTIQIFANGPINDNVLRDTAICAGQSFIVDLSPYYQQVQWGDGPTSLVRQINNGGTYTITTAVGLCELKDTMVVMDLMEPNPINLPADTVLCIQESIDLTIPFQLNATILWSTSSSGNQISVNSSGNYWVSVTNVCGSVSDTILISFPQFPNILAYDTICSGDSVSIDLTSFTGGVLWDDGYIGAVYNITQPGIYGVTLNLDGCQKRDSVQVLSTAQPILSLGPDISFCEGGDFQIVPFYSDSLSPILWNGGVFPMPSVTVTTGGVYWVAQTNSCGTSTDTLSVEEIIKPFAEIIGSKFLCENQTLTLSYNGNAPQILWPNGSNSPTYTVTAPGNIILTSENNGCYHYDTLLVTSIPEPNIELGEGGITCINDKLVLSAGLSTNYPFTWIWSNGSENQQSIDVVNSGTYWLSVLYCDKLITDTVHLDVLQADNLLFIPNVFTPNGDDINDLFTITGDVGNITKFSIDIFNRWGAKLYSSVNILDSWNGKFENRNVVNGVYVYVLDYTNTCGEQKILHGHITVFR